MDSRSILAVLLACGGSAFCVQGVSWQTDPGPLLNAVKLRSVSFSCTCHVHICIYIYIHSPDTPWDCHRTADQLGWLTGGVDVWGDSPSWQFQTGRFRESLPRSASQ